MISFPLSSRMIKYAFIALLLLTFINIMVAMQRASSDSAFSSRNFINKMSDIKHALTAKQSVLTDEDNEVYSLVGYHHDLDTNLVVVQKNYLNDKLVAADTIGHFWNFLQTSNFDSKSNYDLKLINGYNYKKMVKILNEETELQLTNSFVDQYKMQNKFIQAFKLFFVELFKIIEDCKPDIESINNAEHYPNGDRLVKYYELRRKLLPEDMKKVNVERMIHRKGKMPLYGGHLREQYTEELIRNKEYLSMYLTLSDSEVTSLKNSHKKFMGKMIQDWPEDLFKFNKFNKFMKGDGIVYLGGGKYDQLAFLSIKVLRDNGSRLPIEVIIPYDKDYDVQFCDRILPTLNGKCKLMTDYLPKSYIDRIKGFQLKNIALLISSFERILYLDADNIPVKNPDPLFTNKPFTDKHLVLWPDLWRRSTSPNYYKIADIDVDDTFKVRNSYIKGDERGKLTDSVYHSFHDCKGSIPEASSETGQILINKKVHFKTLVLAMYYNFYGPSFFYPLMSQGAAGEGDKETFIAAAHKLGLPYYQVTEFPREFGPVNDRTKKHEIFGMGQYDPIIDYYMSTKSEGGVDYDSPLPEAYAINDQDDSYSNYDFHLYKSSALFFVHANWPKFYLERLFLHNYHEDRGPTKSNGDRRRLYGGELKKELGGYDFESMIMKHLLWCFCEEPMVDLSDVPETGSNTRKDVCRAITNHMDFLKTE
ncbi:Alpha-1,2-mannosyltransferase MNN24 [Candida viswanathii]|uniref:Alpha-1,2-mannosyltransferase MNN24 n=1 Tax=Candida viswanathii TaxID=5486 RepID=A0A367XP80_9ASCO|nr:Alpha-1,2-mannosyltransferase MNN24 [Candida viswanathii]